MIILSSVVNYLSWNKLRSLNPLFVYYFFLWTWSRLNLSCKISPSYSLNSIKHIQYFRPFSHSSIRSITSLGRPTILSLLSSRLMLTTSIAELNSRLAVIAKVFDFILNVDASSRFSHFFQFQFCNPQRLTSWNCSFFTSISCMQQMSILFTVIICHT